jgi:hydrogenase expression/formation protein HypC
MCFAIPARIAEILPGAMPMARLEGNVRPDSCCLAYVPEAEVGDYVIVRNGYAIEVVDGESARSSMALFAELELVDPWLPH